MADAASGSPGSGAFSPRLVRDMAATKPWVRFIAVLGTIGVAIIVIAGIVFLFAGASFAEATGVPLGGPLIGLLYLILAVVAGYPMVLLHQYAGKIRDFVGKPEAQELEAAVERQRTFWKTYGILSIVMIGVSLVVAVVVVVVTLGQLL